MARQALALRSSPLWRVAAFTAVLAAVLIVVLIPVAPSRPQVEVGDIAAQTVQASGAVSYESEAQRAALVEQARRSVPDAVVYNVQVKSEQLSRLFEVYNRLSIFREAPGLQRATRDEGIARTPGVTLTTQQRTAVLDFSTEQWRAVGDEATRVLGAILEEPYGPAELEVRQASVPARLADRLSTVQGEIVTLLVKPLVVPTQRIDEEESARARDRAAASVGPVRITYAPNQVIVREGEPIDEAKLEALRAAGALDVRVEAADLLAVAFVSLLAAATLGLYLAVMRPAKLLAMRRLLLVVVLVGGVTLVAKLSLPLALPDTGHRFYAFALPIAVAPVLIAVLFEAPFALLVAAVLALLSAFVAVYLPGLSGVVGIRAAGALQLASAYFFGGVAGALVVYQAERLNRFFLAGGAVGIVTFLSMAGFWVLDDVRARGDLLWMAGNALAAGMLTAVLAVGLIALIGSLFDVTTRLQLMELAQLNAPLLRRLQEEAPGTFHHSIIVGNLAERAADKIGADALLVRVGAYYHDVGKMGRPAYFIENQLGGENPHQALTPTASARMIHEHVRHGAELARRYRLPDQVRAFIQQHHGTMPTTYFYRIAAAADPAVDPDSFRYPGPRPRSRETALVMLADSVEAAVRAGTDRSPARIDAVVEDVIRERVEYGQFDECEITLRDLRVVAETFKSSLGAIYHPRIEYPAPPVAATIPAPAALPAPLLAEAESGRSATADVGLPAPVMRPAVLRAEAPRVEPIRTRVVDVDPSTEPVPDAPAPSEPVLGAAAAGRPATDAIAGGPLPPPDDDAPADPAALPTAPSTRRPARARRQPSLDPDDPDLRVVITGRRRGTPEPAPVPDST